MVIVEYLALFGRRLAELLGITERFQQEEAYGAFGMSIVIALFFIFFGWIIIRKTRQTRKLLSNFATEMGFSFSPKDKRLMSADFFRFPLFCRGRARGVRNVIRGHFEGVEFMLFDYWYKNSDMSHNYLVTVFPMTDTIPDFQLSTESVARESAEEVGYKDIKFQVDPEFSRSFLLWGTDEAAVRKLFHEGCRRSFNSIDRNEIGGVEGGGHWLVFYQRNTNYMSRKSEQYLLDIRRSLDNAFKVYTVFQTEDGNT